MYYQVEKQDGYYRIGSPENVFSYLFVGTKKAALIDTGIWVRRSEKCGAIDYG